MKKLKFILAFLSTLFAFAVVNHFVSAFRSDGVDVPDGVYRCGFPFVFLEESGPVALDYFSWGRLVADIAIGFAVSACVGVCAARGHDDD